MHRDSAVELWYREYGSGRPLVLLHGLLGSSENWHSIAARLAEHDYRVVAADLRNHGRSPHADRFDYDVMAFDVIRLVEDLALDRPVVIGHSMGGKTAMEMAFFRPDAVGALVVEDAAIGAGVPRYREHVEALLSVDLDRHTRRKDVEEEVFGRIADRTTALFLLKNLHRDRNGRYSWKANVRAIARGYDAVWAGLQPGRVAETPALLVRGAASQTVRDIDVAEFRRSFPRSTVAAVDGAGHWVHFDQPEAFLQLVLRFLAGWAEDSLSRPLPERNRFGPGSPA